MRPAERLDDRTLTPLPDPETHPFFPSTDPPGPARPADQDVLARHANLAGGVVARERPRIAGPTPGASNAEHASGDRPLAHLSPATTQRTGRGRADRRDWHKHRGPYAAGGERHVTLAQAEHEARELRHQWHDDALRREFREWEAEMGELIGSARAWLATL